MDILVKISKQTSWQIIGKIISSISTLIILGIVARNYNEDGAGIFTLVLTYLGIFHILSDFGFNAHILRKFQIPNSKLQTEWRKLLGTRIIWSVILVFFAIILLPLLPFASRNFNQAVLFGSLSILASAIFVSCNLIFQKELRYDLSILSSSLGTLAGLLLFIWLSFIRVSVPYLLIYNLVSWLIIAASSLLLIKKYLTSLTPVCDYRYTVNLFKESWPIAATLALNVIYFRSDAFIVTTLKGVSDAGIYNVAYSVFQSALVLPTFIMNAYYPLMLKSTSKIKLMTGILLGLSFLGVVMTLILAPSIILIITGKGFFGSVLSLRILSLGFPGFFLSSILMWNLISKGKYKTIFIIYLTGLTFNLTCNFIFIPQYSYLAASWITVISEYMILLLQVISLYWFRKT